MKNRLMLRLLSQQSEALNNRKEVSSQPINATIRQSEKDTNQTKLELADGSIAVGYNYSAAQLEANQPVIYQNNQVVTKTGFSR